jgi:hypothetical protein
MSRGDDHGYDDRFEDRPDRDRDAGYDDYGEPPSRGNRTEAARQRVSLPGLFMLICGLISLFISVLNIALLWIAPDVALKDQYEFMKQFMKNQPVPPYEEFVKSQQRQGTFVGIVQILGSVFMTLGGIKMRNLEGYGIAMTGAIAASIPCCTNQCYCLSLPIGIWVIVVLLNAEVKAAFSRG